MAVDSEGLFLHLWRRLSNRLNRVMRPGYLDWVGRDHQPELWARRDAARQAWDDPAVYQDFQGCRPLMDGIPAACLLLGAGGD